ncbi:MAG TPA: SMC-Scp complex subunit ScpB [Candidatus Magasanikbacteria bacterium]|nr:SMC-Scp complex subunit ScpB [Candidatus Magasanikbacteria bacterium]
MSLISQIESILFVAGKPLNTKKISKVLSCDEQEVQTALENLINKYNVPESGVVIISNNGDYQMASSSENKEAAEKFVKAEIGGELTRPQLETLTVISYRGPLTKPEIEQIRGVNCSLILRNLLMRGLVKEHEDPTGLLPKYEVTIEYLRHLGLNDIRELPDYESLHNHEYILKALGETTEK